MPPVHHLAVLVAAVSAFALGGLWYSPALFGTAWMRINGLSREQLAARSPAKVFGLSLLLCWIAALNLALFLGPEATLGFGTAAGFAAGAGWVATSFGVSYLFEARPLRLFWINAGYHTLELTLMGAILGAWH